MVGLAVVCGHGLETNPDATTVCLLSAREEERHEGNSPQGTSCEPTSGVARGGLVENPRRQLSPRLAIDHLQIKCEPGHTPINPANSR